ncbi:MULTISPECIES: GNAT family N-acetyltransferase [Asticcacaulis]|uniref:GNAT family N-acetyltransferase n=1 Tax=Asticcacaulis TaxID=76890 RepID=UPI001AE534F7|nr:MULTISPECIES: GNAT family N-acetyltransferase [Asticcacaulis]MBP2161564.1 ribosomal protein S18 acetylase RimI-like enzyme [Asticcacaulis solisilvae]MDR6802585.1 ribosomal protein S18 acetylase RimI-like enzyme [Asticcacaulis sp. BE141]
MAHFVLDNPVWHALTTRHAHLAEGRPPVLRYPADVSPFAAFETPDALEHLGNVVPNDGNAVVWANTALDAPAGLERMTAFDVMQLVADDFRPGPVSANIQPLTKADVPDILELTALTRPGPFGTRTIEKGDFVGIRDNGRLIAMAGERMCLPGYTEITAICTHPDYQGRGLAKQLISVMGSKIKAEGRIPFLHSLPDNESALRAYASTGFKPRRMWQVNLFGRTGASSGSDGYFAGR